MPKKAFVVLTVTIFVLFIAVILPRSQAQEKVLHNFSTIAMPHSCKFCPNWGFQPGGWPGLSRFVRRPGRSC